MKGVLPIWVAILCICLATGAQADLKQRGGRSVSHKIGPWYIGKAHYEDGSRVCFAHNLNHGRSPPLFSFKTAVGGTYVGSWISFQSKKLAADGETVRLSIGALSLDLKHEAGDANYLFGPTYKRENRQIIEALLQAEQSGRRAFFVVDKDGKTYNYSAASTENMLDYMKGECGFKAD
ncbi:hypothetical protein [Defluviimonas sp. WL0075]|uniref:Uncharacterized protein n=1 Tax=Albidovulum sediminicola TaxID=2984331 RepID=A0ABT2Z4G1_9RHOB|nr:hypothetical protein [Defluviimonas sp. WL0075]MCV2866001.1 hypothetical protein [Defluviimonas sp. WL0075]